MSKHSKHQMGVYKILNLINGRFYIGQSLHIHNRFNQHKKQLLNNKHSNVFLQNDYNKIAKETNKTIKEIFKFEIIERFEYASKDILNKKENDLLQKLYDNQKLCYNLAKEACTLGYKQSKETINKIKETKNKQQHKENISSLMKEITNRPEHKKIVSNNSKKMWKNTEYQKNHSEMMKEKWQNSKYKEKLSASLKKMWKNKDYRDKQEKNIAKIIEKRRYYRGSLLSPAGIKYDIFNIKEFSIEHKLNQSNVGALLRGKRKTHKGWKKCA